MTKTAENHTFGATHTYIAHIREYPPGGGGVEPLRDGIMHTTMKPKHLKAGVNLNRSEI